MSYKLLHPTRVAFVATAIAFGLALSAAHASQTAPIPGQVPGAQPSAMPTPLPQPVPHFSAHRLPPPPPRPHFDLTSEPIQPRDFYCSDTNDKYAACDVAFEDKCEKANGTLSELQDWGGKTCVEPTG